MKKKYICEAGYVRSINDGQEHLISAPRLAELYHVNPRECIFINWDDNPADKLRGYDLKGLKWLRPRQDGNYTP